MTSTLRKTVSQDDVARVVDEIFGAMAGMNLTPSASLLHPDRSAGYIVSAVQIVGSWQGAVRLDIDLELARQVCSRLLGVEPTDLSPDDVCDAAGELANMMGGSIKAFLAPTCRLSLPSVAIGQNYEFSFPQGTIIHQSSFSHESGSFLISIVERQPS